MSPTRRRRRRWPTWILGALALLWVATSVLGERSGTDPTATDPAASAAGRDVDPTVLTVRDQKDGDSWVASDGREYRLGMVNTPEPGEACFDVAHAFTRDFLDDGFTVDAYGEDGYGRVVAEVFDTEDRSLNVALARSGLADDRYLEQFRHENPDLGRRLDDALDAAETPSCR